MDGDDMNFGPRKGEMDEDDMNFAPRKGEMDDDDMNLEPRKGEMDVDDMNFAPRKGEMEEDDMNSSSDCAFDHCQICSTEGCWWAVYPDQTTGCFVREVDMVRPPIYPSFYVGPYLEDRCPNTPTTTSQPLENGANVALAVGLSVSGILGGVGVGALIWRYGRSVAPDSWLRVTAFARRHAQTMRNWGQMARQMFTCRRNDQIPEQPSSDAPPEPSDSTSDEIHFEEIQLEFIEPSRTRRGTIYGTVSYPN